MELQVFRLQNVAIAMLRKHAPHVNSVLDELKCKCLQQIVTQTFKTHSNHARVHHGSYLQHVLHVGVEGISAVRASDRQTIPDSPSQDAAWNISWRERATKRIKRGKINQ